MPAPQSPLPTPSPPPAAAWRTRLGPWLATGLRLGLAVVMFASSIPKFADLPASVRAVRAYALLPEQLVPLVGYGLPVIEFSLGLLLLLGLLTRPAAVVVGAMMVVFIAGIASAWARGLSIDCGCFGGGGQIAPDQTTYLQEVLRDLVFLAAAALLAWRPHSRWALDTPLGLLPPAPDTTKDAR